MTILAQRSVNDDALTRWCPHKSETPEGRGPNGFGAHSSKPAYAANSGISGDLVCTLDRLNFAIATCFEKG